MTASHLLLIPLDKDMYGLINPIFPNGIRIINKIQAEIVRHSILAEDYGRLNELISSHKLNRPDVEDFLNRTIDKTLLCTKRENSNITLKQLDVWIHVTNNCNLNCHYCFVNKTTNTHEILSSETANLLLEKLKEVIIENQTEYVSFRFSGGEPLLSFNVIKDFVLKSQQILDEIGAKVSYAILTNLVLLKEEHIRFITKEHININVSLDGIASIHDSSRNDTKGFKSFSIVDRNINKLIQNGIRPRIMAVLNTANYTGILDLIKYVIDKNLSCRIGFIHGEPINYDIFIEIFKKDIFPFLIDAAREGFDVTQNILWGDYLIPYKTNYNCMAGIQSFLLHTNGDIYYCPKEIGNHAYCNIHNTKSLSSILKNYEFQNSNILKECDSCLYKFICSGGCPLDRKSLLGFCQFSKEIIPLLLNIYGECRLYKLLKLLQIKQ
jgi:uncharacterized protein